MELVDRGRGQTSMINITDRGEGLNITDCGEDGKRHRSCRGQISLNVEEWWTWLIVEWMERVTVRIGGPTLLTVEEWRISLIVEGMETVTDRRGGTFYWQWGRDKLHRFSWVSSMQTTPFVTCYKYIVHGWDACKEVLVMSICPAEFTNIGRYVWVSTGIECVSISWYVCPSSPKSFQLLKGGMVDDTGT